MMTKMYLSCIKVTIFSKKHFHFLQKCVIIKKIYEGRSTREVKIQYFA